MSPRMWAAVDLSTTLVGVSLSTKLVGVYPVDLPQQATATSQPTNPSQTISQPYLNPISTLSQPYPQPYPPTLSCQLWPPNVVPQPLRLAMAPNLWRHSVVPPCGAALLHPSAAPPCCTTLRRHSAAVHCGTLCGSCLRWHPAAAGWCSQLWQHPVPRTAAALCAGRTVAANTGAECPPPSARGELWM